MTLRSRVVAALRGASIPHALIGAGALAVHGVTRATLDFDLFVLDSFCLRPDAWADLESQGVSVANCRLRRRSSGAEFWRVER